MNFTGIEKTQVKSSFLLKFVFSGSNENLFVGFISFDLLHQTPKTISNGRPRKYISNFTGIEKTQVKSSFLRFHFVKFEALSSLFSRAPIRTFLPEYDLLH